MKNVSSGNGILISKKVPLTGLEYFWPLDESPPGYEMVFKFNTAEGNISDFNSVWREIWKGLFLCPDKLNCNEEVIGESGLFPQIFFGW